ncbi:MAG: hypothetical protein EBR82_26420 [Caulobacteraceae bacterium]|nr:hypothetical protein [Caulobacteraceae bacterium]
MEDRRASLGLNEGTGVDEVLECADRETLTPREDVGLDRGLGDGVPAVLRDERHDFSLSAVGVGRLVLFVYQDHRIPFVVVGFSANGIRPPARADGHSSSS